ncbi:MAG: hypothetical protein OEW79_13950, partial [Betaproteobacteria bacterium]|nr:hypothetical protein [Betaproteobacteria bacterium]
MKLFNRMTGTLMLLAVLAGCAMPASIVPNDTSANELLQRLGKPTDVRPNAQGGEFWEYAYGPEGTETWLFGIDSGMVRSSTQLLTRERLQLVVPGVTTEAQVRELLGKPRDITRIRDETAWEWRVDMPPNLGLFVVRFA